MITNQDVHESMRPLLKLSREMISRSQKLDYALISSLERDPLLKVEGAATAVEDGSGRRADHRSDVGS